MKVVFTIDSLLGGGAETSILDLIRNLSSDLEVTVVYFYNKHDLRLDFEKAPCKLVYFNLQGNYDFYRGIRLLTRLIRNEKFDVIVTSLFRSGIISRISGKITGVPVVDTIVNDSYGVQKRLEFKGMHVLKFYVVKLLDRMTAGIPKMWISNSKTIAKAMSGSLHIPGSKIIVINRGRNADQFKDWQAPALGDSFEFAAIGRLFSQKGYPILLEAFSIVFREIPKVRLTIYGEGPIRHELEQQVRDLHMQAEVSLPGRIPEAWRKLYHTHCYVLPSLYEGFSGALIEAMLVGLPIVASDIPMNREAITEEDGFLFTSGDSASLADRMKHIIQHYDEAVNKGIAARKKAMKLYNIRHIASQYEGVLKEVAEAK